MFLLGGCLGLPGFFAFADPAPLRSSFLFVCSQSVFCLQYFEILEDVVVDPTVGDVLVLVDFVDDFFEMFLVVLLLVDIENYGAADQRSQDVELVFHLLYF